MIEEKIKNLVNKRCLEEDLNDCFLVDIQLSKSSNLTVFIDSDEGVNYKKCKTLSRFLETAIEENKWLPEKYTLNVSSPGADRPLSILRQYHKHISRDLVVKLLTGEDLEGQLLKVGTDTIVVKTKESEEKTIPVSEIDHSVVVLKFK